MRTTLVLFSMIFYSCISSQIQPVSKEDKLYTEVFCELMRAKHQFRTPNNISRDTVYILDEYFIDSTSLYYNQMNVMFEVGFIDSINFPNHKQGPELWNSIKKFNAQMNVKQHHNINATCLDTMKVKFISANDAALVKRKHPIFLYSPLIPIKEGLYKIYEDDMPSSSEYYYSYTLKNVDGRFKYIRRTFYTDVFWKIKEDYIKTVDFNQSYEEYIGGRK